MLQTQAAGPCPLGKRHGQGHWERGRLPWGHGHSFWPSQLPGGHSCSQLKGRPVCPARVPGLVISLRLAWAACQHQDQTKLCCLSFGPALSPWQPHRGLLVRSGSRRLTLSPRQPLGPWCWGWERRMGRKRTHKEGVTSLNKASLMSRAFRGHLCSQGPSRQGPRATGFYGTRGSLEGNVPWAQEYVQMIYAHREGLLHPSTELDLWSGQRDRV